MGLPGLSEYAAVNWTRTLRHHTQPQVKGVPLGGLLGWYVITYATFSLTESTWSQRGLTQGQHRVAVPASTAVVATSLDLLLDCVGLDLGMWEWAKDGTYARDIRGPNGKCGIPLVNFAGWLGLTSGVSLAYLLLAPSVPAPRRAAAAESSTAGRQAAYLLLPYYLLAVLWSLWRRKPWYLLPSASFPVMLWRALRAGTTRGSAGYRRSSVRRSDRRTSVDGPKR